MWGFPGGSVVENLPANAGDMNSIPWWGRSPRGGNGTPLQYSCLENLMDRGAWQATVHGVAKSQTQLNNWAHTTQHVCQALWFQCWLPSPFQRTQMWLQENSNCNFGDKWKLETKLDFSPIESLARGIWKSPREAPKWVIWLLYTRTALLQPILSFKLAYENFYHVQS